MSAASFGARDVFAKRYATDNSGDFHRFVDAYGDGSDLRLTAQVMHTHELLCSMVDRTQWIAASRARIAEAIARPLKDSALGKSLMSVVERRLKGYYERCRDAASRLAQMPGFESYVEIVTEILALIELCRKTADIDKISRLVNSFESPKLSPKLSSTR